MNTSTKSHYLFNTSYTQKNRCNEDDEMYIPKRHFILSVSSLSTSRVYKRQHLSFKVTRNKISDLAHDLLKPRTKPPIDVGVDAERADNKAFYTLEILLAQSHLIGIEEDCMSVFYLKNMVRTSHPDPIQEMSMIALEVHIG